MSPVRGLLLLEVRNLMVEFGLYGSAYNCGKWSTSSILVDVRNVNAICRAQRTFLGKKSQT